MKAVFKMTIVASKDKSIAPNLEHKTEPLALLKLRRPKAAFKMTIVASDDMSNVGHRAQHPTRSVIKN